LASKPEVKVSVPKQEDDRPNFGRLGTIVAVCFVIGALWPRLAGVTLVPRAPINSEQPAAAAPSASAAPSALAEPPEEPDPAPAPEQPQVSPTEALKITKTLVVSCRDDQGRKVEKCDEPDISSVATPKIHALLGCDAAQDAEGVLSLGLDLDFKNDVVRDVSSGKSTTLSSSVEKRLLGCAKKEFSSTSLKEIDHEHARYQFFFLVEFTPASTPVAAEVPAEEEKTEASGTAVVVWESARVRDEPSKDGEVKARILYGARVIVQARKGEWYEVKYDGRGRTGWIHQNAIGKK
jgi:hypothetical protein